MKFGFTSALLASFVLTIWSVNSVAESGTSAKPSASSLVTGKNVRPATSSPASSKVTPNVAKPVAPTVASKRTASAAHTTKIEKTATSAITSKKPASPSMVKRPVPKQNASSNAVAALSPTVSQSAPPTSSVKCQPCAVAKSIKVARKYPIKKGSPAKRSVSLAKKGNSVGTEDMQIRRMVATLVNAYERYSKTRRTVSQYRFSDHSLPRATVLTCSGGPVAAGGVQGELVGNLYRVHDIGNQVGTVPSTIEYGVRNLHTPLLIIIGNATCKAIKDAASDYSTLTPVLRKQLDSIDIPKGIDPVDGALLNVNNQVETAILMFSGEVESSRLAVIGAFYDENNALKYGKGQLIITNLNGETDPKVIQKWVKTGHIFNTTWTE